DVIRVVDRGDEDATVPDLARARGPDDCLNRRIENFVGDNDLDLHFRQETDVVLLAAIDGRMTLLPAVPTHLAHGHPGDVELVQAVFHLVHLVRADDGLNEFHESSPASVRAPP